MTKSEYWAAHCKRNPRLNDEDATIQMTVAMLHKLMDEAFERGREQTSTPLLADLLEKMGSRGPF